MSFIQTLKTSAAEKFTKFKLACTALNTKMTTKAGFDARLLDAAKNGNIEKAQTALSHKADVDATEDYAGKQAICFAAENGRADMIDLLMAAGAKADIRYDYGYATPLLQAVEAGHEDAAKALVKNGASVNFTNSNRTTAMMVALYKRNYKMMETLHDLGANLEAKDKEGMTVLARAVASNDLTAMRLLLDRGAKTDVVDNDLDNLFDIAKKMRRPEAFKMLLSHQDNVTEPWQKRAADEVAHVQILRDLGYKLTTVFNFSAEKITTLSRNLETGIEAINHAHINEPAHQVDVATARTVLGIAAPQAPVKKIEIFIDMDGVLSDFDAHAKAHDKFDAEGKPKWDLLDQNWWKTMPVFAGALEFYNDMRKLGATRILTAPVPMIDSFAGKASWTANFRPESGRFALLDLCIVRASDKNLMAAPGRILIDDREKNIKEWVEEGGIGIHHTGDFADTKKRVEAAIASLNIVTPAPVQKAQAAHTP